MNRQVPEQMLINPFIPTEIASADLDFFGRRRELSNLDRALQGGSVLIQGPIGIGKSSLLARALLLMQDLDPPNAIESLSAVADREIETGDQLARLLLEELLEVDEGQNKCAVRVGVFSFESSTVRRNFQEGRHLAALKRVLDHDLMGSALAEKSFLVIAIDEADKCPVPMARMIRSLSTHLQARGHNRTRFLLAGVSPFQQLMLREDEGVGRFFQKTINLQPMTGPEASRLLREKLNVVKRYAAGEGIRLNIKKRVIARILELASGHPHLLQLLGSHVVESENERPDGIIDEGDLVGAFRRICYEERAAVYDNTIHLLEIHEKLAPLRLLLENAAAGFPTRVDRMKAGRLIKSENIQWLIEHNILAVRSEKYYGLVDEFLRIRLIEEDGEEVAEA